jgi:hypothetical protein
MSNLYSTASVAHKFTTSTPAQSLLWLRGCGGFRRVFSFTKHGAHRRRRKLQPSRDPLMTSKEEERQIGATVETGPSRLLLGECAICW